MRQPKTIAQYILLMLGLGTLVVLGLAWRQQTNADLSCRVGFGELAEHNGYFQIDVERQHPTEQLFDAKIFASSSAARDQNLTRF